MSTSCESREFTLVLCRLRRRATRRLACHRPDPRAALAITISPAGVSARDGDLAGAGLRAEAAAAERALADLLSRRGEPAQADGREFYLNGGGEVRERSADPPEAPKLFVPRKPR